MLTLADIVEGVSGRRIEGIEALASSRVNDVVIDSRQVAQGDVFVALPGERADGHEFVAQAFARGAIAALVSRDDIKSLEGLKVAKINVRNVPNVQAFERSNLQTPLLIRVDDPLKALQQLSAFWRRKAAGPKLRVIGVTGSVGKTTTKEMIAQVLGVRYRVLKSEGGAEINRAFVLQFPDRSSKERFFTDPRYLEIRRRLFEPAVRATAIIAEYRTDW